jgi:hypothetical protein
MALTLAVCRANGEIVRAPGPLLLGSSSSAAVANAFEPEPYPHFYPYPYP